MSLLRLLSAGKSLDGLKDSTARYRMGHPRSMPKFGSGKNPFQSKAASQQPAVMSPAPPACAANSQPTPELPVQAPAADTCETRPSDVENRPTEVQLAAAKPVKSSGSFLGVLLSPL